MAAAGGSPALPWRAHAGTGDAKKDPKAEVQMKAFVSGTIFRMCLNNS